MADKKKPDTSDSEDDGSLETDALPLPAPQAASLPENQKEKIAKPIKKSGIKKCSKQAQGFEHTFFKQGLVGMFSGSNISTSGQNYFSEIQNANYVHIGPNVSITQGAKPKKGSKASNRSQDPKNEWLAPKEYFSCDVRITDDIINDVSLLIGYSWRSLGRDLGYGNGELEIFHHDRSQESLKEVVYEMLCHWRQKNGKAASIGRLIEALWKVECRDAEPKFKTWIKNSSDAES